MQPFPCSCRQLQDFDRSGLGFGSDEFHAGFLGVSFGAGLGGLGGGL